LTETDNPGGPEGYVELPGMPGLVEEIVRGLAEIKNIPVQTLIDTVQANMLRFIREAAGLEAYSRMF
jgi:Tat protein secretion system quality control protein TatD with DNase activity